MNDNTSDKNQGLSSFNEGGSSCSLKGAIFFTYGIKDALALLHAGPGCSYCAYYGVILHSGESYPFVNTGMCSHEIIFGGEESLKKGLFDAQEIHAPKLIIVISGCQAVTIGDDIEGVITDACDSGKMKSVVVSSKTGGYDGDLYYGFVKTGLSCLKYFCKELPVQKKLVNIIGFPAHINVYWKGDLEEIRSLLEIMGLEINCFFPGSATIEQIKNIPAAELNLVVDEQLGLEMAEFLKNNFGTPYIKPSYGSLIGTDNTMEFLLEIIRLLDLPGDIYPLLEMKRNKALQMASQCHHLWNELFQHAFSTFALTAHASMALGLSRMLISEIGLEPKVINLNPSFPKSKEKLIEFLRSDDQEFDPVIIEDKDNYEMRQYFNDEYPSLILGKGTTLKSDALMDKTYIFMSVSYPALDRIMIYNRPIMGFNGVPAFLDDIMNKLAYFF